MDIPGEMHRCLRSHLHDLQRECMAAVIEEMRKDSKSIMFKPVVRRACARYINQVCANPQGKRLQVVACLQNNLNDLRMPIECKNAVKRDMADASADVRFSPMIATACEPDRDAHLCFMQPRTEVDHMTLAEGSIFRCLAEKREKLKGRCQFAVMRQLAIAAKDIRLDPTLNRACHDDQVTLCSQVLPGAGRVQACLRKHFRDLSADCKSEEFQREIEVSEWHTVCRVAGDVDAILIFVSRISYRPSPTSGLT